MHTNCSLSSLKKILHVQRSYQLVKVDGILKWLKLVGVDMKVSEGSIL